MREKVATGQLRAVGGSGWESDTNMPAGRRWPASCARKRFFSDKLGVETTRLAPDSFGYTAALPQRCTCPVTLVPHHEDRLVAVQTSSAPQRSGGSPSLRIRSHTSGRCCSIQAPPLLAPRTSRRSTLGRRPSARWRSTAVRATLPHVSPQRPQPRRVDVACPTALTPVRRLCDGGRGELRGEHGRGARGRRAGDVLRSSVRSSARSQRAQHVPTARVHRCSARPFSCAKHLDRPGQLPFSCSSTPRARPGAPG